MGSRISVASSPVRVSSPEDRAVARPAVFSRNRMWTKLAGGRGSVYSQEARDKCWPLSQFLLFVKSQTLACDIGQSSFIIDLLGQSSLEALVQMHPEVCLLGDFKSDQADDKD